MLNRHEFPYLPQVAACLPDFDDASGSWQVYAEAVTPRGRGLGGTLSEQGTLQVALWFTPPFRSAEANPEHLVDRRIVPPESYACQNRSQLIEALAHELWAYDKLCTAVEQTGSGLQARVIDSLGRLEQDLLFLVALQQKSTRKVKTALLTIGHVIRSLAPENTTRSIRKVLPSTQDCQRLLITRLHTAFKQYGPFRVDADAIDHAIAAILVQFGMEKNQELTTIANKYRQRRTQRHRTPPSTFVVSLYASLERQFPPATAS